MSVNFIRERCRGMGCNPMSGYKNTRRRALKSVHGSLFFERSRYDAPLRGIPEDSKVNIYPARFSSWAFLIWIRKGEEVGSG